MELRFHKYQGTGNDFIIIDAMKGSPGLPGGTIRSLCDRRYGIGADGLMEIMPDPDCDFRMRYYNADGPEASLCANGSRCIVAYAAASGYIGNHARFRAFDGFHTAEVISPSRIRVQLLDTPEPEARLNGLYLDTGSPHYVEFHPEIDTMDVFLEGRKLRNHRAFEPAGTNVNFVQHIAPNRISVRTYERGVENETLSCGTGVVASAISAASHGNFDSPSWEIITRGGILAVGFKRTPGSGFRDIWIEGPAEFVFRGTVQI